MLDWMAQKSTLRYAIKPLVGKKLHLHFASGFEVKEVPSAHDLERHTRSGLIDFPALVEELYHCKKMVGSDIAYRRLLELTADQNAALLMARRGGKPELSVWG